MKEGQEWIGGEMAQTPASTGFIVEKWSCGGGHPQEPTATYRLEVDKRRWLEK
jgi:hypothetical protein